MSKPEEYYPNQYPPAGPPPAYSVNPPPYQPPQPGATVVYQQPQTIVTTQPTVTTAQYVVVAGATCPACRAGILRNEFTCCGILLAICFFPIGMLCCFLMMERRCSNCGLAFG